MRVHDSSAVAIGCRFNQRVTHLVRLETTLPSGAPTGRRYTSANGASIYQPSLKSWIYAFLYMGRSEGPAHPLTRGCYGLSARFLVVIPFSWAFSPGCYVLAPLALQRCVQS